MSRDWSFTPPASERYTVWSGEVHPEIVAAIKREEARQRAGMDLLMLGTDVEVETAFRRLCAESERRERAEHRRLARRYGARRRRVL